MLTLSVIAAAAAANSMSIEASTQASSGTFEVCRLPLTVWVSPVHCVTNNLDWVVMLTKLVILIF